MKEYYDLLLALNDEWAGSAKLKTIYFSPEVFAWLQDEELKQKSDSKSIFELYIEKPLVNLYQQGQISPETRVGFKINDNDEIESILHARYS